MMWILLVLLIVAHIYLLLNFPRAPKRNQKQCYDIALVLGCPANADGSISRMQQERMNKAIQLYKTGSVKRLLLSGAGVCNTYVEAQIMATYAIQNQVPETAVFLETKAKNTYDNLRYAKQIYVDQAWQSILVITSQFHVRRSNFFVKKHFQNYAMEGAKEHDGINLYLMEYIRMWNTLRYEIIIKSRKTTKS